MGATSGANKHIMLLQEGITPETPKVFSEKWDIALHAWLCSWQQVTKANGLNKLAYKLVKVQNVFFLICHGVCKPKFFQTEDGVSTWAD